MDSWKQYQEAHKEQFLAELIDLLKIPSISARSENKADMLHCAEVVKQRPFFRRIINITSHT